jgi:hypothetical protein
MADEAECFVVSEEFECPYTDAEDDGTWDLRADSYSKVFLPDLLESARSGCPVCILHYDAVQKCFPDLGGEDDDVTVSRWHMCIFRELRIESLSQKTDLKLEFFSLGAHGES